MAQSIVVTHGMDDVLGLENPETYDCRVWNYQVAHSWLEISLHKEKQHIFVNFGSASHFEGALHWQGAKFRTAPEDYLIEFLKNSGYNAKDIEIQRKHCCLYLVDTPHSQIRILALTPLILTDQLREYHQSIDDKLLARITTDVANGEPCVVSTISFEYLNQKTQAKTPISKILEYLEQGYPHSEILSRFTWLEPEDIQAALIYARRAITKPSDTP